VFVAEVTQSSILQALGTVYDPCCREKNLSVVDMGLVRSVTPTGDGTRVELMLTTGWCPFAATLVTSISDRIRELGAPGEVDVEVVWDEPWTTDRLSADARRKLRFLPDPSTVGDRDAYVAAREDA
jgi:metal-sulfur cluster biosynthetic enzyme